jgi:hypothetical protein
MSDVPIAALGLPFEAGKPLPGGLPRIRPVAGDEEREALPARVTSHRGLCPEPG